MTGKRSVQYKKKAILWLTISAIFICGVLYLQFYMRRSGVPQLFGEAVRFVETQERVIALTFDDGPNPESTEKILSLLGMYGAKATFFVIGRNAEKYPEIVEQIIASGNELGNHSWSHERLTYKKPAFIKDQIEKTDDLLRLLGYDGYIPFRAPYGHKLLILPYILMNSNRTHYLWNIELNDWESPSPEAMLKDLQKQIKPGAILLLHDGYNAEYQPRQAVTEFVELFLEYCTNQNYKVVSVSELKQYNPAK